MGSRMAKFLKSAMSRLLMPGPRRKERAEFPSVPTAGARKTSVRKLWLKVRSDWGSAESAVTSMRAPWLGDPVISVALTNE
jgi:hypothetical protein